MELFDVKEYIKPVAVKIKHKRHYKTDNPYNQLYKICYKLALLLPSEMKKSKVFSYKGLKIWRNEYGGCYEYQGEFYQEPLFINYECEIIGTENWDIEERLKIHQQFYNLYIFNHDIEKSMDLIKSKWNI